MSTLTFQARRALAVILVRRLRLEQAAAKRLQTVQRGFALRKARAAAISEIHGELWRAARGERGKQGTHRADQIIAQFAHRKCNIPVHRSDQIKSQFTHRTDQIISQFTASDSSDHIPAHNIGHIRSQLTTSELHNIPDLKIGLSDPTSQHRTYQIPAHNIGIT